MVPADSVWSRNRLLWAVLLSLIGHGIVLFGAARLLPVVEIPISLGSLRVALTSIAPPVESSDDRAQEPPAPAAPSQAEQVAGSQPEPIPQSESATPTEPIPEPTPAARETAESSSSAAEKTNDSTGSAVSAGSSGSESTGPQPVRFSTLATGASLTLPTYPAIAKRWEYEGTVRVRILVAADGTVEAVELSESSGHDILDEEVLHTIQRKWSFPPPGRQVVTQKSFTFQLSGS